MKQNSRYTTKAISRKTTFGTYLAVFGSLIKFRLTLTVVISSVLAFLIAAGGQFTWTSFAFLTFGGFFITAAANTLNEVLEKDYDKLMNRTSGRPLPSGTLSPPTAVLLAGLMALAGTVLLGMIGPLVAFIGMISLVLYAFIYTPLKRYTPASVMVGAIPGALPAVIGVVAFTGSITPLAIILFAIQFFWQFPHFWAIAWVADSDYKRAGFQLLPSKSGDKDTQTGIQSMAYIALLTLSTIPLLVFDVANWVAFGLILCLTIGFFHTSLTLYRKCDDKAAKNQMLYSFAYLPLVFLIIYINQLF